MPERRQRPLHAIRHGEHDDPPASESLPTSPYRRTRWHRARRATADGTDSEDMSHQHQMNDTRTFGTSQSRRRQRSPSWDEDDEEGLFNTAYTSSDRRRGHDELRQRLLKRRRIDLNATPVSYPPIKYGYFGQVVPGRLKMIMISCDGGEHNDPKNPTMYLGPHNILRADKSVYCSARRYASIILRHADDTPFSLTQITIMAPEHGFQAPVSHGVVHVSMSFPDVDTRTKEVFPLRPQLNNNARLSLQEALQDQEIRRHFTRTKSANHAVEDYDQYLDQPWQGEITLLDNTGPEPEDPSSQDVLESRLQRMQDAEYRQNSVPGWRGSRHLRRSDDFSRFVNRYGNDHTLAPDAMATQSQDRLLAERSPDNDPQTESISAPFLISPDRDKVTIKFKTSPSARFILLKLASDEPADSIAVQSVIVMGYGGPRIIPASDPR